MKRLLAISLLIFMALLSSGTVRVLAAPAKDKALLRLRLKAGQRFVMRVSTDGSYASSSAKQAPKPKGAMTFAMRVIKVMSNGQMKIEMRIVEMRYLDSEMNLNIPPTVVSPQMIVRAMKDAPLTMTVTARGEILNVTGYEGVARRVIGLMPAKSHPPASRFKSVMEMAKETFNPQSSDLINMGQQIYPLHRVGVGDTWQGMTAFGIGPNPLPSANSHYRLVRRANGVSSITATGHFSTLVDSLDLGNEKTRKSIEGTQITNIQVDEKTGLAHVINGTRTSRWITKTFQQDEKRAPDVRLETDTFHLKVSDH